MGGDPVRVGVWGFFGIGNIGNEASLDALLGALRVSRPDVQVTCLVPRPEVVEADHGVAAERMMAFRGDSRPPGAVTDLMKALGRLRDVPRTWRLAGAFDAMVVPGTGVFESDLMTSPWGMPYWLFLTSAFGRLRRRPVVLLSVGATPSPHPVTRRFNEWTVRLASYCSFRDEASRDAVGGQAQGPPRPVLPDLAVAIRPTDEVVRRRGEIVIGVMAYDGPGNDPQHRRAVREAYTARMTELVLRLLDRGRSITFVIGDVHDEPVGKELQRRVASARPDLADGLLRTSAARTFRDLLHVMGGADAVIASRFHNVVAGVVAARPTVSLGYAPKNVDLLRSVGLPALDQPIGAIDVELVMRHLDAAMAHNESGPPVDLSLLSQQVGDQFDQVFAAYLRP